MTKIIIHGVPVDISEGRIKAFFSKYEQVEEVIIGVNKSGIATSEQEITDPTVGFVGPRDTWQRHAPGGVRSNHQQRRSMKRLRQNSRNHHCHKTRSLSVLSLPKESVGVKQKARSLPNPPTQLRPPLPPLLPSVQHLLSLTNPLLLCLTRLGKKRKRRNISLVWTRYARWIGRNLKRICPHKRRH